MNILRALPALLLAALTTLAVAGCTSPPPPDSAPSTSPAVSAALGEVLSADGWNVTVDKVTFDAAKEVAAANEFNPPPGEGEQYALVDVTLSRTGTSRTGLDIDIALVVDEKIIVAAPAAAPAPLHLLNEFTTDSSVSGQVAFLAPADVDNAAVRVTIGPAQAFLVQVR